jgi:hypothetical protein
VEDVGAWVVEIWSRKALKVDMSTRRVDRLEGLSLMLCSTRHGGLVSDRKHEEPKGGGSSTFVLGRHGGELMGCDRCK